MSLQQALAEKIHELLAARQWSQRELARRLGVSQASVSYILGGKRRADELDFYFHLARVFDVPLSVLIADLEQRVARSIADRYRARTWGEFDDHVHIEYSPYDRRGD